MKYYMQILRGDHFVGYLEWDTDSGLLSGWDSYDLNHHMKETEKKGYVIGWKGRVECKNPCYSFQDFVTFLSASLNPTWQIVYPNPLDQVVIRWPEQDGSPETVY